MKYLHQYIKKNYPNVIITKSEAVGSLSTYYNINDFYIRISDHLSPLMKHCVGTCHLEIIQPFGVKDNFIIIHTPTMRTLMKKRSDVNTFIKNMIEVHSLEKDCKNIVKVRRSTFSLCEIIENMNEHTEWQNVGTLCGRTYCWLKFTKEQRKKIKELYTLNVKITAKQLLSYLDNIPKHKSYTNKQFDDFIEEFINKI